MTARRGYARPTILLVAVAGLVLVALAWQGWQLSRARRAAHDAGLAADTLRAALDTSRRLSTQQRKALGDSLDGATRLVAQLRQESDALDKALGETRTANAQLVVRVQRLTATVTSTAPVHDTLVAGDAARSASFRLRQPPYTIAATALLPPPPASGRLDVDVAIDSATIALRLGCSTAKQLGVRSAIATATGPAWLPLAVGRVEQSPEVCNPPPATVARLAWWRRCAPAIGPGYGVVLAADGRVYHGWTGAVIVDMVRCLR